MRRRLQHVRGQGTHEALTVRSTAEKPRTFHAGIRVCRHVFSTRSSRRESSNGESRIRAVTGIDRGKASVRVVYLADSGRSSSSSSTRFCASRTDFELNEDQKKNQFDAFSIRFTLRTRFEYCAGPNTRNIIVICTLFNTIHSKQNVYIDYIYIYKCTEH